jgi:hypothetical protein
MSKRISLPADETKLLNLMNKFSGKFSEELKSSAMKNIDENKKWIQSENYQNIVNFLKEFLAEKETTTLSGEICRVKVFTFLACAILLLILK